ncbi:MAG: hypothetical protein P0Y53_04515 [Candidatus Pseudobacter hemicellulosilyticus]|uniref:Uncharacterized protein n=1 Tax=Candidatus Pseudobacter hemicellulosilyticus TaxID=3121375 RepID=A0AAJ6BHZ9_9BACT|nr:MAG: hypothetical protein P0Y53_04515 [Pseudobacter sp.]
MLLPNYFRTLRLVHLGMIFGLLLFLVMGILTLETGMYHPFAPELDRTLQVITILLSAAATVVGFNVFKRKILAARNSDGPAAGRIRLYMSACFLWWALMDAPAMLALLCFFMVGNYAFVALAGFHLLVLLLFMPRKQNIIVLLQLTEADLGQLEGKGQ